MPVLRQAQDRLRRASRLSESVSVRSRTMTEKLPEYKIFALKYATREARRADHFIGGDPHDGPMPMDYFTWVVVGPDRVFLVDTGFTAETAARRKRTFLRCPIESLRR